MLEYWPILSSRQLGICILDCFLKGIEVFLEALRLIVCAFVMFKITVYRHILKYIIEFGKV